MTASPPRVPRDIPELPAIPGIGTRIPSYVPPSAVSAPSRRPAVAVFRLLTALTATVGVATVLIIGSPGQVLSRFTVQSSILLALVLTVSARRTWTARRPLSPLLTGGALLYVLMAGLVHHLVLANSSHPHSLTGAATAPTGWEAFAGHLLHTAIPVAALLDWVFLSTPGRLRLHHTTTWMLYPLAYLAFTLTRAAVIPAGTPDRYLYTFLDPTQRGYLAAVGNALLLGLACYAVALLLVAADHLCPALVRHRPKTGFRLRPPVG